MRPAAKSAVLAETRPSTGRLVALNAILYSDAFAGVKADLAYVNRRDGMAQEVILREALPGPEFWGLDPETTRLEVMTEFVEAPAATVKTRVLRRLAEGAARAGWQSPDWVDEEVSFGAYRLGRGRAFDTGSRNDLGAGTEVAKRWEEIAGRRVLFEQIEWRRVRDQINRLPMPRQAKAEPENPPAPRTARLQRQLPQRPAPTVVQASSLPLPREGDASRSPDFFLPASTSLAASDSKPGLDGISPSRRLLAPGYVLDYELVASASDFTFQGDTTYHVTGPVSLTGTTTLEGGAVIKFASAASNAALQLNGPLDCQTARYRPVVFTAEDDDSVGELITGSSGTPSGYYANPALRITTSGAQLHDLRIAHAQTGIYFDDYSAGANEVRDCQLVNWTRPSGSTVMEPISKTSASGTS